MSRLRQNLIPPPGLPRQLAFQSLLFGIGRGAFLTGSAVYFTQLVGLQPWEIGVALSMAAAVAMGTAVPLSTLADRYGARDVWVVGALLTALLFAAFPITHGFLAFALLMVLIELVNTIANAGRNVYTIEALEPETRVIAQAFSRSWLNVGWGGGAALAGLALALDTPAAYHSMVFVNVLIQLVNAVMIRRLPSTPAKPRAREVENRRGVFRDRPYLAVNGLLAVLLMPMVISLEVAPLWMITHTDAPKWILAVATRVNTIMATTLQVALTRGSHTIAGARRVMRWAGWIGAACCPVFYFSGLTAGWATVALLLLATMLVTMSELWQSAAVWTLMAELAPPERRGEYGGAARMLSSAQMMIGPAALIALAVTTGGWGWFVIAVVFLAAAVATGPAVDWAQRTRPETGRPTVRANPAPPEIATVK